MYLTNSRPDIMTAVAYASTYSTKPTKQDFEDLIKASPIYDRLKRSDSYYTQETVFFCVPPVFFCVPPVFPSFLSYTSSTCSPVPTLPQKNSSPALVSSPLFRILITSPAFSTLLSFPLVFLDLPGLLQSNLAAYTWSHGGTRFLAGEGVLSSPFSLRSTRSNNV